MNLAIRKDGAVEKVASYTGCVAAMGTPGFFDGDPSDIARILGMYEGCQEFDDVEAGILAPYSYGLIVADFDGKTIFDMQGHAWTNLVSANGCDARMESMPEWFKRGWVHPNMHDLWTGEPLKSAWSPPPRIGGNLFGWMMEEGNKILAEFDDFGEELVIGAFPLPGFKLSPPGWTFLKYDDSESKEMREAMGAAGFVFSSEEDEAWRHWAERANDRE